MELKVVIPFQDKITMEMYDINRVINIDNEKRANDIINKGLAVEIKSTAKPKKETKPKKDK